tara:strand:+ start:2239 stop:3273 length:1035 start_codon:yes stop_codon:yes gene_type:complete
VTDCFEGIVGQTSAISVLRNAVSAPLPAYLFVGPPGCGARTAATRFAAELLAADSDDPERTKRLVIAEEHPDLIVFERNGPALSVDQAKEIVRVATTSPYESNKKIIFVEDIHLAFSSAPMILKVLEEPPPTTLFILTAEEIPVGIATIASRCTRVEFEAISPKELVEHLVGSGVEQEHAVMLAAAANNSIDRAMLLASDEAALDRWNAWAELHSVLDGSGSSAAAATDRLLAMIDAATAPLQHRHEQENKDVEERAERFGERGAGRRSLEDRHKRELRRLRTDELLMGMTALGNAISKGVADGSIDPSSGSRSLTLVTSAAQDLRRNGNERLLMQRLFVTLKV